MYEYDRYRLLRQIAILLASAYLAASQTTEHVFPIDVIALNLRAACPANTYQCPASLGALFQDICCQDGQVCALDSNSSPACCPSGATCTGVAPTTTPSLTPTHTTPFVSNSYFSFPCAPTSFPNSASCVSAAHACSHNFDACVTELAGGSAFPITIAVPGGGGITVGPTKAGLGGAQVLSICSSLSSEACSTLAATNCDSFGQTSAATGRYSVSWLSKALIICAIFTMTFLSYET